MMIQDGQLPKDGRLPKQRGDFGEILTMFVLGTVKKYRVALVDHVGADIIATDRENGGKKYAISVKTRMFITDGPDTGITTLHQNNLKTFAREFDLTPVIAFVMMDQSLENIDIYMIRLDEFEKLAGNTKGLSRAKDDTLRISNAKINQQSLQNNPYIDHTKFSMNKGYPHLKV